MKERAYRPLRSRSGEPPDIGPMVLPRRRGCGVQELGAVLDELLLPDDIAELRQLVDLCRNSLTVRSWLFARFANQSVTQAAFRTTLSGSAKPEVVARLWSSQIAEMVFARPKASTSERGAYGGLSRSRILLLIARHQYELTDLKTFLLVRLWIRCVAVRGRCFPANLCRITLEHWAAMMADGEGQFLRNALNAVRFFHARINRTIGEVDFGPHNSWKIHLLLHILDSPKPCYRVSELQAGLPAKYRHVAPRAIRRFCRHCGIRRDTRPGRRPISDRKASRDFSDPPVGGTRSGPPLG